MVQKYEILTSVKILLAIRSTHIIVIRISVRVTAIMAAVGQNFHGHTTVSFFTV